ncbi:ABC transporter ATP-binding protein [Albimonas sp. CAU 1670]|uniref:ABC transporter ATP-binding protein n=1 Tax=Albimonas sp. CAU 1670 TaxID=3032599 RepID=UPI0023DA9B2E|nr:ABC transporter ATP-binding protein [Albimonas sp. CAU 1670]MDF2231632.1 ABC transporter ATP-binding protein [Albimonas sp. CAU 1670]
MLAVFRKLMYLLDARERRRFRLLVVLVILMGVANMAGVAAIFPLIGVMAEPGLIETNPWLARANALLGFEEPRSFILVMGLAVFVIFTGAIAIRAFTAWALYRFGSYREFSITTRLLRSYMSQPHEWFLGRHSADLTKAVLNEVGQMVNGVLYPSLDLMANTSIVTAMVVLMILVNPFAALLMAAVVGGAYVLIFSRVRKRVALMGERRFESQGLRYRFTQDAMMGAKELKVLGLEQGALDRFDRPAMIYAKAQASSRILAEVPRHLLEGVAFGGMILVLLLLMVSENGNLSQILPVIGIYALAGARMLPAMQLVYRSMSQIRFNASALNSVYDDIKSAETRSLPSGPAPEPLHLRERLALEAVDYSYPNAERTALEALTIEIPAHATVGIVGGTGAGKSTAMDILLGLLPPRGGALTVDGRKVEGEDMLRAWRRSIGYVPQHIFLIDATVRENIAFGLKSEDIDDAAVERAARMAELHDFVVNELPQGYETRVGDRGARLSGGQRQRVGIARALYHDPDVLIMDEATSALDNITERAVIDAVARLGGSKTIVMVAHRLSTVRNCDRIFLLERGAVSAAGTYDELIERSDTFREMALGTS